MNDSLLNEKIDYTREKNESPPQSTSSPALQWKSPIEENNVPLKVEIESRSQSTSTPALQWKSSIINNL